MKISLKKDLNLISRNDKTLENAIEGEDGSLFVLGVEIGDSVSVEHYIPDGNKYRLKSAMHVCRSKLPDYLQHRCQNKNIPNYPGCSQGKNVSSCKECYLSLFD